MKKPSNMYRAEAAARQRLIRQERREAERAEAQAVDAGIAETVALSEARGTVMTAPKAGLGRVQPVRRMSGLDWLATRSPPRINEAQKAMGERWGAYWRAAVGEVSLKSGIAEPGGGGGDPLRFALDAATRRVVAGEKLDELNAILLDQASLLGALEEVCGREKTPREASRDGHQALRVECLVCVALDMLVEGSGRPIYSGA